jgi:hypothetical protein
MRHVSRLNSSTASVDNSTTAFSSPLVTPFMLEIIGLVVLANDRHFAGIDIAGGSSFLLERLTTTLFSSIVSVGFCYLL